MATAISNFLLNGELAALFSSSPSGVSSYMSLTDFEDSRCSFLKSTGIHDIYVCHVYSQMKFLLLKLFI